MHEVEYYSLTAFTNSMTQNNYTIDAREDSSDDESFTNGNEQEQDNINKRDEPTINIPAGKNEIIVTDAIARKDIRLEDIPDEFNCPISCCIMTNPVYSKNNPNSKFNFEHIKKWLENNKTDPLSRQPLKIEDLVPDEELSRKISAWLEEKCLHNKHQHKP